MARRSNADPCASSGSDPQRGPSSALRRARLRGSDGVGAHEPAVCGARLSPLPGRTSRYAAGTAPPSAGPANETFRRPLVLSSECTRAGVERAGAEGGRAEAGKEGSARRWSRDPLAGWAAGASPLGTWAVEAAQSARKSSDSIGGLASRYAGQEQRAYATRAHRGADRWRVGRMPIHARLRGQIPKGPLFRPATRPLAGIRRRRRA